MRSRIGPLRPSPATYYSTLYRSHPRPFLKHTLRQRTQHRYRHNLLRFLLVHDRRHRRRRRRRRSGRRRRHLLVAARLRQVIDGREAAERRLESLGGRRHADRCRSARFKVRKIIPRSPQNARFIVLIRWRPFEPRMEKENGAQLFPRFRHVTFHLLFVSSMSRFGTGYRTALSIFTLPSILRIDRSYSAETDACTGKSGKSCQLDFLGGDEPE